MVAANPILIEPETPAWWKRAVLSLNTAFLQTNRPLQLKGYATADLPDPAQWVGCIARDLTLNQPVYSDGANWNAL